jgi:DNA-binding LacI/PurR family transcriptional regulator
MSDLTLTTDIGTSESTLLDRDESVGASGVLVSPVVIAGPELQNRANQARVPRRHEQAKQAVRDYIRINRLSPGSRLPTEEVLCRNFGWSRATVARALNDLAGEGTLNRIQGSGTYVAVPDETKRTFRILVSSHPKSDDDDYCAPLFAGLRQEAARHPVSIVYHNQTVPTAQTLEGTKVDGVLALSWHTDDLARVLKLHQDGVCIVGLALRSRTYDLPLISADNFDGMCQAVEHLLRHGHQRIAYTCVNLGNSDILERLYGLHHTMARAGLSVGPDYFQVQVGEQSREVSVLEAWWRSMNPKPSAIIMDTADAPVMLAVLANQGVRVPEDLSVVVIDERAALRHHVPALTVVRQPVQELGRRGLAKLLAMLRGEDDGAPEILPTELVVRDSVRHVAT